MIEDTAFDNDVYYVMVFVEETADAERMVNNGKTEKMPILRR